jgi:Holliday junction resolvase
MRESEIENKVCSYGKKQGFIVEKFCPKTNGYPDRIFLKNGCVFFIEFKAKGKTPTKLQNHRIETLKASGFDVFVVDNVDEGIKIVQSKIRENNL